MNRPIRFGTYLLHAVSMLVVIICVLPVFVVTAASFRNVSSFQGFALSLSGWTFKNYTRLVATEPIIRWLANSLIVAFAATFLEVIIDSMAAFAFTKLRFRGRQVLFVVLISTMMLPFSITLVPTYLLVTHYGMSNTYEGLVLPAIAGPFGVYLMRQYVLTIPDSLLESATIDGASSFRQFRTIVLPLSVQPMAVLAIFTFVTNWNSFLWPLLISNSSSMFTITVGLATTSTQFFQNDGAIAAEAVFSLAPMIILFAVFQRYFVQGLLRGSVKE